MPSEWHESKSQVAIAEYLTFLNGILQHLDLARTLYHHNALVVWGVNGNACGVIASVFETLQSRHQ